MRAIFLEKKTDAAHAFKMRDIEAPKPNEQEVLIEVKAFGLNYADVMARLDLYPDMPKMPCVLGYDVIGKVIEKGSMVHNIAVGDFVVALTRFGGYAEKVVADSRVCIKVPEHIPSYQALAFATQLSTAYQAAMVNVNLFEGDHVLIHAAAGGVGLGLVQIALHKKCEVIALAGSDEKCKFLKEMGVKHTINYKNEDWVDYLKKHQLFKKIDVIFDSVGGDNVPKGLKSLNSDGKLVLFGSAKLGESKNKIKTILQVLKFGFYSPIKFLMSSRALIGLNMLAIADRKPHAIERSMKGVLDLYEKGIFKTMVGETYTVDEIAKAHTKLEKGQTMGKIAIEWS